MQQILTGALLIIVALLPGWVRAADAAAPAPPAAAAEQDAAVALPALAGAVSVATALLSTGEAPPGLLDPAGCVVWYAPGVALVPALLWPAGGELEPSDAPPAAGLTGLLEQAYAYTWGVPPQPREEDYAAGRELPEQVYLAGPEAAQARLKRYAGGYAVWNGLNPGLDYTAVPPESLAVECAVIYGSPYGTVEFYFVRAADGKLYLRHLVSVDYFSA